MLKKSIHLALWIWADSTHPFQLINPGILHACQVACQVVLQGVTSCYLTTTEVTLMALSTQKAQLQQPARCVIAYERTVEAVSDHTLVVQVYGQLVRVSLEEVLAFLRQWCCLEGFKELCTTSGGKGVVVQVLP